MKETVSFRTDSEKLAALDRIANAKDRDRTYLINEAISNYISMHEWHKQKILQGLAEIEAGTAELVSHEDAMKELEAILKEAGPK